MAVDYGVVHVDKMGYRVAGTLDILDDKGVAHSIVEIARGAVGLARGINKPLGTVTVNWNSGTAIIKIKDGEIISIILDEKIPEPPATINKAKALT